jgi:hypothetical protein
MSWFSFKEPNSSTTLQRRKYEKSGERTIPPTFLILKEVLGIINRIRSFDMTRTARIRRFQQFFVDARNVFT